MACLRSRLQCQHQWCVSISSLQWMSFFVLIPGVHSSLTGASPHSLWQAWGSVVSVVPLDPTAAPILGVVFLITALIAVCPTVAIPTTANDSTQLSHDPQSATETTTATEDTGERLSQCATVHNLNCLFWQSRSTLLWHRQQHPLKSLIVTLQQVLAAYRIDYSRL